MGTDGSPARFEIVAFRDVASPDDLGELSPTTLDLARTTFGGVEGEQQIRAHLAADFVAIGVERRTRRALGLSLLRVRSPADLDDARRTAVRHVPTDATIGYLHGSAILPEAQGTGLYRALNRRRIQEVVDARIGSVLTTTQNPKVESGLVSHFDRLVETGTLTAWRLERAILREIYGQLLTPHQPATDGTPFEVLDRDAGDAFSLLFSLTYPSPNPVGPATARS